jgi:hypothetical protein
MIFVTLHCHPKKAKPIEYQWVNAVLGRGGGSSDNSSVMFFSVFPDHGAYRRHHQIKSKQLIPEGVKVGSIL